MRGPQRALQVDDHGAGSMLTQLHGVSTSQTIGVQTEAHKGRPLSPTQHGPQLPNKRLVLTHEADPIFFDAVKNEHFLRNGSRNELQPEVMDKFAPFLRKQAKLTQKRTRSMDNWTGSLSHVGAMKSANPDSGAYNKYGSVDSDIVNYVNPQKAGRGFSQNSWTTNESSARI
jgi:hypothetical protein